MGQVEREKCFYMQASVVQRWKQSAEQGMRSEEEEKEELKSKSDKLIKERAAV